MKKLITVIAACFLTVAAPAATIYVDADAPGANNGSSWTDAYKYLQDALADADSAAKPVEIRVAQGIYKPDRSSSNPYGSGDPEATFQLINEVILKGGCAGYGESEPNQRDTALYETILSGDDNSYHVVTGSDTDETAVIDGFTVTRGFAGGYYPDPASFGGGMYNEFGSPTVSNCTFYDNYADSGGGMANLYDSDPTVTNCTFSSNWVFSAGGGMYNEEGGNPTLTGCSFIGNYADYGGGGMYNTFNSYPKLINCIFSGNTTSYGGGMCNEGGGNPTLTGCSFIGNSAEIEGGGMDNSFDSSPELIDCIFSKNSGEYYGGGMANWDSSPAVTNCTFRGNTAVEGGGMFNYEDSSPTVTSCTFSGNSAGWGGGMDIYAEEGGAEPAPKLINCTFSANFGEGWGGGISIEGGDVSLENCILWTNTSFYGPQIAIAGTVTINYCNIQGGQDAIDLEYGVLNWGAGNIDKDPSLTPDGHLRSGSVCINSGDPAFVVDVDAPNDIDGENRLMDGLVEVGADEFLDSDGDGLPDFWEMQYFGDPNIADANDDPDDDEIPNIDEYELYSSHPDAAPYYVDAYNAGDPCEDGSPEHPFDTIQEGIDAADDGDTVLVAAGIYAGPGNIEINFGGKLLVLKAMDGPSSPVIYCDGQGRGFNFSSDDYGFGSGATAAAAVIGFIITGGRADYGGAIECDLSSPQFRDCIILGNSGSADFWGSGGVSCYAAMPTFADCVIIDNDPYGIFFDGGGARIEGVVNLVSNDLGGDRTMLYGDGVIQMDSTVTLYFWDSRIRCNISGPGTIQVCLECELIIEKDAIIDLAHGTDPDLNGQINCDGLLTLRDEVAVVDAKVYVSRASFEDNVIILNSVVTAEAGAPYGQFYIQDSVQIWLDRIESDGDRYLDFDPTEFDVNDIHINVINVNITEGIGGTEGGLFELRGKPGLVDGFTCDPNNELFCRAEPGTIPPFDPNNWTINKLELVDGAKLNLTNRFDFQAPYDSGGDEEVLYVKHLILGAGSVLNTAFQQVYYETLDMHPTAEVVSIPLLGFSLVNITFDDQIDYLIRVKHNNFTDPSDPSYNRIHIERVTGQAPDPCGMMQMRTLKDKDPGSPTYQDAINAIAKGTFAKATEDEDITIEFEYLFTADPYNDAELVVYLSDDPEPGQNLREVARLRPPAAGRPGSIGSNRFAVFSGKFPHGGLNFVRGTYIELRLSGSANASCLVNNWDPRVNCIGICGDFNIELPFPLNIVNIYDYLVLVSECGLSNPGGIGKGCLDLIADGCVNSNDLLAWGTEELLNACGQSASTSGTDEAVGVLQTALPFENQGNSETEPLLVCGKPASASGTEVPGSCLYSVNTSGVGTSEPNKTNSEGRLVTDSDGNVYQIDGYLGLINKQTQTAVVQPDIVAYGGGIVLVGYNSGEGILLSDAVFRPGDSNIVYIVPVQVDPQNGNCPYMAAAKLRLTGGGNYNLLQLYGKNPAADPCQSNTITDCDGDLLYEPDVQHLHEIEIDSEGNLFVLSSHWSNENNWLLVYDEAVGNDSEIRLPLTDTNIVGPTAMVVSSFADKLYLTSSSGGPNDLLCEVYRFSIDKVIPGQPGLIFNGIVEINCPAPGVCETYPGMYYPELGYISMITSMTENPADGTLYVTGFTAPKFPGDATLSSWPYNQAGGIFTTPMFAEVEFSAGGIVEAVDIIDSNLALPSSLVWTGPAGTPEKCGGADIYADGTVNLKDYAVVAKYWLENNCAALDDCEGADLEPAGHPDGDVDSADLAILCLHWLETGCQGCGGADIYADGIVNLRDFNVLAGYWLETNCAAMDDCDGADLEPVGNPDGDVDMADLAVLCLHWMGDGCPD